MPLHRTNLKQALAAGIALLVAHSLCAATPEIWLTATANSHAWPGSSNAPFYVRNATALASIQATNLPCTFHYAAGTYQTLGFQFGQRNTANAGCKHFGAGIDKTIIQLVGAQPGENGIIFGNDADYLTDNFELHDMTLDCNAVHNAVFTNHWGACMAVGMAGNNLLLSGLKVIGFGTGHTNTECFPVNLSPLLPPSTSQTNIQNAVVQNCIFTAPAPTNACGVGCCTVGAAPGWNMVNFVIRNCSVSNLYGLFPNGPHAYWAPLVENCLVENCASGVYCEPGYMDEAHRDWIVRSNTFQNVQFGVYIGYGAGQRIKSFTIDGNQIQLKCPPSAAFGCTAPQPPQGEGLDWLVLRNNTVIATNCLDPTTIGFSVTRATQAVVQSNRLAVASGRAIVLDSSTVSAQWFSGNINATGALVFVTNSFLGSFLSQDAATMWQNVAPPRPTLRLITGP